MRSILHFGMPCHSKGSPRHTAEFLEATTSNVQPNIQILFCLMILRNMNAYFLISLLQQRMRTTHIISALQR